MSRRIDFADAPDYEVFALRYATQSDRCSSENYLGDDPLHNAPMPLDFYVWVIRSETETIVVDTGFTAETAGRRRRTYFSSPIDLLKELGADAEHVEKLILTHMHYDHAGNISAFPRARIYVQESEVGFCTGRCMCHASLRKPFELHDVQTLIGRVYADRVHFAAGDRQVAPGVSVHHVGGHTSGLQVVRVRTRRGNLVLASDAAHYWDNLRSRAPFPIVVDVARMLEAHETIEQLADGPDHIIPGHDPGVLKRFLKWRGEANIVALHESPISDA